MARSARYALAAFGLVLAMASAAHSQTLPPPPTVQSRNIVVAFRQWAARNAIANTSIAVMTGNRLLGSFGKGTHTPTTPVPIASNSKAITAVCIAKLVDDGTIKFTSKLGAVLRTHFRANPPLDIRAKSITIGQLLTHSSGIVSDGTAGLALDNPALEPQVTQTFAQALGSAPGTTEFYHNMNYAVLGFVIETVTGQDYEIYCNNRILVPVGVTDAVINPPLKYMSSWGGWLISAVDYGKFLSYYLQRPRLILKRPATWPQFPTSPGSGVNYALGSFMAPDGLGHDYWHTGSASFTGTVTASFGADFSVIADQVRYNMNYEPTLTDPQLTDLDASLTAARNAPVALGPVAK